MTRDRSRDAPKTAAELMAELEADASFRERSRARDLQTSANAATYAEAAAPLLRELSSVGLSVDTVGALRQSGAPYPEAIPILLRWLPRIVDPHVREDVVRTLSVPWAKPDAARPLVEELDRTDDPGLRWAIANALEVVADDSVFEEISRLVRDRSLAGSRQMLAVSLGNMRDPRALDLLLELLDDEDLVGHAAMGLAKLRAAGARARLQELSGHPKRWVRAEIRRALEAMEARDDG